VGYSLAIVCSIASLLAMWLLFGALPDYRRRLDEERGTQLSKPAQQNFGESAAAPRSELGA
jgi:hypothetical protein